MRQFGWLTLILAVGLGAGVSCGVPGVGSAAALSDDDHQDALRNAKMLGTALLMYANDNDELTPPSIEVLKPYARNIDITGFTYKGPAGVDIRKAKAGEEYARKDMADGYVSLVVGSGTGQPFTPKWVPK